MRSLLALPLVAFGAVACGGASADVQAPTTAMVAPPPSPPPSRPNPSPAVEPRTALVPPAQEDAEIQAKQGEDPKEGAAAEVGVAGETDVMRAQAEMDARANAEQQAKDKLKWEKMGRDVERKAAYDDARDRVSRASARVAQAQNQLSRVPAARRVKYNNDVAAFGTRKADVQSRMNALQAYGSDEWRRMRDELYRALDELDAAATRVENDLF